MKHSLELWAIFDCLFHDINFCYLRLNMTAVWVKKSGEIEMLRDVSKDDEDDDIEEDEENQSEWICQHRVIPVIYALFSCTLKYITSAHY